MNKKFHITIKDNEDGMIYMDDDVIGILGAMLLNEKGSTRAVVQTPNAMNGTLEESKETAILNAHCIKAAEFAIAKLLEGDILTAIMYQALKNRNTMTETVKIDFEAIKENFNK